MAYPRGRTRGPHRPRGIRHERPLVTYLPELGPSQLWGLALSAFLLLDSSDAGGGRGTTPDRRARPVRRQEPGRLEEGRVVQGGRGQGRGRVDRPGDGRADDGGRLAPGRTCPTTDYELTFEARRTEGGDFFAAATFPVGASFLTLVNGGWGGSVTGLSSINGADASENETNRFVKYQNGTWYRFRVRVTDAVVRCRLDDKEIFAVRHEGQQLKTRVEVRGCQPLGFAS